MAPEQGRALPVDHRADLFSLGCVLYQMLTGQRPFAGADTMAILSSLALDTPPAPHTLNPQCPAALSRLVIKLLEKDPAARPASAQEVIKALADLDKSASPVVPAAAANPRAGIAVLMDTTISLPPPPETSEVLKTSEVLSVLSTSRRRWPLVAAALLLAFIPLSYFFGGQIIRVVTNQGELVVAVDDPAVEIKIVHNGVEVQDKTGKRAFTLTAGKGEIEVSEKDGIKLATRQFELTRGGKTTVKVTFGELAAARKPNDPGPAVNKGAAKFTNKLGMEFALVPKGKAWLGGGGGNPGNKEVEIKQDFYLGVYEVTQEEWEKVIGLNPSSFQKVPGVAKEDQKRFPVETVSWEDAQIFIDRVNAKEKEAGWVYRLPSEVEWEYACRGGPMTDKSESAFDFYLERPANLLLPEQVNFEHGKGLQRTCRVGNYRPNRLGLYDMHGNVWEWCADEIPADPQVPKGASHRVPRGGGWNGGSGYCRAAHRDTFTPSYRSNDLGLRLARVRGASGLPGGVSLAGSRGGAPGAIWLMCTHEHVWHSSFSQCRSKIAGVRKAS